MPEGFRIHDVVRELNAMVSEGVVESYAIGGAVGATFYLEPVATVDIDVFVDVRLAPGKALFDPTPLFEFFASRGHSMEGEYVIVSGWPVQFLASATGLVEEALKGAINRDVDGESVRVFSAEHLAAICLQTGRAKDKARLLQFLEEEAIDRAEVERIVLRHGLGEHWLRFKESFGI